MKIALLAPHNAGKTSYLTSLYSELKILNNSQSTLSFTFNDSKNINFLENNIKNLKNGEMLGATSSIGEYQLHIKHIENKTSSPITLIDFPGEYLFSKGDSKEIEKLKLLLPKYDAFIILIDGEYASRTGRIFERKTGISKINEILYDVVKRRKGTKNAFHGATCKIPRK